MTDHPTTFPVQLPNVDELWDGYWARVGNEDMLAARALLELSPGLLHEARCWLRRDEVPVYASAAWDAEPVGTRPGDCRFRWQEWLASYDESGRGWSSTEHDLFAIAASLLDPDRPVQLHKLRQLGSWELDAWRVLLEWRCP